jgi:TolA-binding protein
MVGHPPTIERAPLVSVTDHAAERHLQRVRGSLDPRTEIAARVATAWTAGRAQPGRDGAFGSTTAICSSSSTTTAPGARWWSSRFGTLRTTASQTEGRMGFMDKAKQMAEQGKQKLEEAQTQFNERKGEDAGSGGPAQEYDEHGRPAGTHPAPPPSHDTAPHGDPLGTPAPEASPGTVADRPIESHETKHHGDPLAASASHAPAPPRESEPAEPSTRGAQEAPDDEDSAPPKMTKGDPLSG